MRHTSYLRVLILLVAGLFSGCGGGGGGAGTTPPPVAKSSISGTVSFPSLGSLVAKEAPKTVAKQVSVIPAGTVVQAYTVDGKLAASGTFSNYTTGAFTIQNLTPGTDYVIKAVNPNGAVLRKLVEKTVVIPNGEATGQNLNDISTAAVTVASQKLTFSTFSTAAATKKIILGDPLPTGVTPAQVSTKIFSEVSPRSLEEEIQSAKQTLQTAVTTNDFSGITKQSLVDLVNVLNIVIAALDKQVDPATLLTGTTQSVTPNQQIKQFSYESAGVVSSAEITSVTPSIVQSVVTSSAQTYTPPPRVELVISTDAPQGGLYGLTLDITIPPAALDVTEQSIIPIGTIYSGTLIGASWNPATRTMRVIAASPGGYPLPSGQIFSFASNRQSGQTLTASDFTVTVVKATDAYGQQLATPLTITKTVTTSGQ